MGGGKGRGFENNMDQNSGRMQMLKWRDGWKLTCVDVCTQKKNTYKHRYQLKRIPHTEIKKHKRDNNIKHVTKQLGNNKPSSALIIFNNQIVTSIYDINIFYQLINS